MNGYLKKIDIRWADLDPNFHVLHSKYYDYGATCRMCFLTEQGVTLRMMEENHVGLIIFREECRFRSELKFGDEVTVSIMLDKVSDDYRKWTIVHELWKNVDTLAAVITLDGAWMDTRIRKVSAPPDFFIKGFDAVPKTKEFMVISKA